MGIREVLFILSLFTQAKAIQIERPHFKKTFHDTA